ncbi:MAG: mechanosensitive ion channel [Bacteroidales bacterium]|nr:mechanosensitive ion channel [Bacteroidales bacterium]
MLQYIDKLMEIMLQAGMSESLSLLLLRIGVILSMLILAFVIDRICRKAVVPTIRKVTSKTEFMWDDYLLNDNVLNDFCMLIAPVVVYFLITLALPADLVLDFLLKFCRIYIIVVFMKLLCSIITAMYTLSSEHDKMKNHSMKGFYQMLKLVVICIGTIVIISNLVGKNPGVILTGLGAGTAILMLVFQDTIKGFVAGIQLIANDMLRPGDWICAPKYGADGDVLEVTLTTVKVQNWDKTIVTVPPYALVNDSFQNWRGMFDHGGRRVKRSINIDMNTVRFCTKEEMEAYRKQPWMEGFEDTGNEEVNLYIFRHYVDHYLRHHPKVNPEMTLLVRQLQPTAQGLPVELYFFSADTGWINYENIQAEVFEHVLAVLHTFGLKVFQAPAGTDLYRINTPPCPPSPPIS